MTSLKGRNALVTGSNGGIGYAIATALADEGRNIMLNGPGRAHGNREAGLALAAKNIECIYSPADARI